MKVLFLGGNGNISWWCVDQCVKQGYEVFALNRGITIKSRRSMNKSVTVINTDLRDVKLTKQMLEKYTFDVVCDFICYNAQDALNAIDIFKDKTKQYIFISSDSIFRRTIKNLPFAENSVKYDRSVSDTYIRGKLEAEEIFIDSYEKIGFPVTIVRPGLTYDTIVPVSIGHNCFTVSQRCLNGKPLLIAGEGNNLWTFTHSSDFAGAFIYLVGNNDAVGEDYNISSDEWTTWNKASKILLDVLTIKEQRVIHIPFNDVLYLNLPISRELMLQRMWHNIYNTNKIKKVAKSWTSHVSLETGLRQTIDWLCEDEAHRRFIDHINNRLEIITKEYSSRVGGKCYMCGNEESIPIPDINLNMKILGDFFKNEEIHFTTCTICGNVYIDINATQDDFNTYYKSSRAQALSYYEVYGKKATDKYFNDILSVFKNRINQDSYIIDIASGIGDFSLFLKNNGYNNISGLDVSDRCVKLLKEKDIDSILSDTVNFDKQLCGKYDLAVFVHSLEHYLDFNSAILSAKKMLKENGYLYIETPDAAKYCDVKAVPYSMFTYEHTFHLTLDTMDNISRVFGLKLIDKNSFFKADSYHVVYGLFQNGGKVSPPVYTDQTRNAVINYANYSKEILRGYIEPLEKSYEKLILWGIGASTAFLLNSTFDHCNIIALIDRNPAKQNIVYTIGNKQLKIEGPETIIDEDATIVVLPYWYKNSIVNQIKELGFKNKIIAFS